MKPTLLLTIGCLVWTAWAQAAPVTLEECLERADRRSSAIKSLEAAQRAAQESVAISKSSFFPALKLRAAYTLDDNPQRLIINGNAFAPGLPPGDVTLTTGDRDTYGVELRLQQPLFTGWNLTETWRRSERQEQAARHDTAYLRSQTAQWVKESFTSALAARLEAKALAKSLAAGQEQARVVQERVKEGYAQREDLLAAQLEVSRAEAAMARGENQSEISLATLRKLIDAAPEENIEPAGYLDKPHFRGQLGELTGLGLRHRADLQAFQSRTLQEAAEVGIARSLFYPQVSLFGAYLRQQETAISRPEVWSVGVQAEWSIFEWGRTVAEVRRSSARAQQEAFRADEAAKSVRLEIERSWLGVKDGEAQLRSSEALLVHREFSLEKVLSRFQEGYAKRADVLVAEAEMWKAYAAYLRSAADLAGSLAGLERSVGMAVEPWVEHAPLYQPAFDTLARRIDQTTAVKTRPLSQGAQGAPGEAVSPPPAAPTAATETTLGAGSAPHVGAPAVPGLLVPGADELHSAPPEALSPSAQPAPVFQPAPAIHQPSPKPSAAAPVTEGPKSVPAARPSVPLTTPAALPQVPAITQPAPPASPSAAGPNPSPAARAPSRAETVALPQPLYVVQFGAYHSRANARRVLNSLRSKTKQSPHLRLLQESGMFKVIAGPFADQRTALHAAARSGVKENFVKVIHGP